MEKSEESIQKAAEAYANTTTPRPQYGYGVRHFQAVLLFCGLVVSYIQRLGLTVAVVQMTTSDDNKVHLTSGQKALVLSSFFWGYSLLQVYFGALGRRGYALRIFAIVNIVTGALSVALPFAAIRYGFLGICACRLTAGIIQGCSFPCVYNLLAKWAVPQENVAVTCFVNTGTQLGSLVAVVLSGYIGYHFDWPAIFYSSGLVAILFGVLQWVFGAESPQTCRYITKKERDFMELSFRIKDEEDGERGAPPDRVPWKAILTSPQVLAQMATMWCASWGNWTLASLTPSFVGGILHFDLKDNGVLSSLPPLSGCVVGLMVAYLSPLVKRTTGLPDSFLRRMWNSIGMYTASISLVVLVYAPVNAAEAVVLLVVVSGLYPCVQAGHFMTHLDLSPNFAGVIMSIANSVANTASIIGPLLSTYLIQDTSNKEQWCEVFLMASMAYFVGNTVYLVWCSTKRQPWDTQELPDKRDAAARHNDSPT